MLIFLSMLESDEERRLFTDLYNQYGNMMLHVAKRYFPKDMYAAEDVVQNAWIRLYDEEKELYLTWEQEKEPGCNSGV